MNLPFKNCCVALVVVMLLAVLLSLTTFAEDSTPMPYMNVWFENNGGSTYILLFNLIENGQYYITLYDTKGSIIDNAIPYGYTQPDMPMDDFSVPLMAGYTILVEEEQADNSRLPIINYTIPDIVVEIANIHTEVVSGLSNQTVPVEVVVFEREYDEVISQATVTAPVIDGHFSADFSGLFDITPLSDGLLIQPDLSGNRTITNWWAPNPALMVDPTQDTLSGSGWLSEVTVIVHEGTADEQQFTIPVSSDTGDFEDFKIGIDIYPGMLLKVSDWMTVRILQVSQLHVSSVDIESDQVVLVAEPSTYVQCFILEGAPPMIDLLAYTDGLTDTAGQFIADFSSTSPMPYDIRSTTWGFIRTYDGNNNATLLRWQAADFLWVPGDLNGDALLNKADVKILVQVLAGRLVLNDQQKNAADLNQDKSINAQDLKLLLNRIHEE